MAKTTYHALRWAELCLLLKKPSDSRRSFWSLIMVPVQSFTLAVWLELVPLSDRWTASRVGRAPARDPLLPLTTLGNLGPVPRSLLIHPLSLSLIHLGPGMADTQGHSAAAAIQARVQSQNPDWFKPPQLCHKCTFPSLFLFSSCCMHLPTVRNHQSWMDFLLVFSCHLFFFLCCCN